MTLLTGKYVSMIFRVDLRLGALVMICLKSYVVATTPPAGAPLTGTTPAAGG